MTLQAKLMLRRPMKWKPAHCKDTVASLMIGFYFRQNNQKTFWHISESCLLLLSLKRNAFFPQSFSGLYGGRRKLSNSFHPSITSDNYRKWRRAQYHCCRAAAGLHDHSMAFHFSFFLSFFFTLYLFLCFFSSLFLPLLAADKTVITGDPAVCYPAPWISWRCLHSWVLHKPATTLWGQQEVPPTWYDLCIFPQVAMQ